jgi:hypothetical protein
VGLSSVLVIPAYGCIIFEKCRSLHDFHQNPMNCAFGRRSIVYLPEVSSTLRSRESCAVLALSCANLAQALRGICLDNVLHKSCTNLFRCCSTRYNGRSCSNSHNSSRSSNDSSSTSTSSSHTSGGFVSSVTRHRRLLDIVGYSTSSVTRHRRLLNIVGDSTSSTLSTIEIRRLIKNIQDY